MQADCILGRGIELRNFLMGPPVMRLMVLHVQAMNVTNDDLTELLEFSTEFTRIICVTGYLANHNKYSLCKSQPARSEKDLSVMVFGASEFPAPSRID